MYYFKFLVVVGTDKYRPTLILFRTVVINKFCGLGFSVFWRSGIVGESIEINNI